MMFWRDWLDVEALENGDVAGTPRKNTGRNLRLAELTVITIRLCAR
jgi:hypothetical protein